MQNERTRLRQMQREMIRNTPYSYNYAEFIDYLQYTATESEKNELVEKANVWLTSTKYSQKVAAQTYIATLLGLYGLIINGSSGAPISWVIEEIKRAC